MKTNVATKLPPVPTSSIEIENVPIRLLALASEAPTPALREAMTTRKSDPSIGLAELEASIRSVGVILPLVFKTVDGQKYVTAGNRRLVCLRAIYGGDPDAPIPAIDADRLAGDSLEIALATNIALPTHPVDRFEVIAMLVADGMTEDDACARFAMTPLQVKQTRAIAALAPEVRDAWRTGTITAEIAQTFTIEPDRKRQAKILADLGRHGFRWVGAHDVRQKLVGDRANLSRLVNFVGVAEYESAGGKVQRDLFQQKHAVSDAALLKKLADGKLTAEIQHLVAVEGWGWAFAHDAPDVRNRHGWRRDEPRPKLSPEEKARIADLRKVVDANDDSEAAQDAAADAREEIDAIENVATLRAFRPEDRKKTGCVVSLDEAGRLVVAGGYHMPKATAERALDRSPEPPTPVEKKRAAAKREREAQAGVVSASLDADLAVQLRLATKAALAMEAEWFFREKRQKLPGTLAAVVSNLVRPEDRWHRDLDDKVLATIREHITPKTMNVCCRKVFDAKDYFGRVPKAHVLAAIREAVNDDEARKLEKKPKGDIEKWAVANVVAKGWLPKQMRTPHYDGPGGGRKAKKKR